MWETRMISHVFAHAAVRLSVLPPKSEVGNANMEEG
jgi:hypothetical protein